MYRLYRLGSLTDPEALWLDYEWDESFDNSEWRPCVDHFLSEVVALRHEVFALPSPEFVRGEDFVKIDYLVDGTKTTFSSDLLLSLIVVESNDPRVLRSVWNNIGKKIGWVAG